MAEAGWVRVAGVSDVAEGQVHAVEDGCIECPLHAARFDVKTGKALCAPAETNLQVFEVKVEGGDLLLKV